MLYILGAVYFLSAIHRYFHNTPQQIRLLCHFLLAFEAVWLRWKLSNELFFIPFNTSLFPWE